MASGVTDYRLVVDTREQVPLVFDVPTVVKKLDTGDYSVTGYEDEFTIERKRTYRFKRLLVVATYAQVGGGAYPFSRANPRSVIASLAAFEARYGVPVVFAANPREAVQRITDWARYYVRERLKESDLKGSEGGK